MRMDKRIALVPPVLGLAVALLFPGSDFVLLLALGTGIGIIFLKRDHRSLVLAGALAVLGIVWNDLADATGGCSALQRGHVILAKLTGALPFIGWDVVGERAFGKCKTFEAMRPMVARSVVKSKEADIAGHRCERYSTPLGDFWLPMPARWNADSLVWEMVHQRTYEGPTITVQPGDVVVDCGAHVGFFTAYALNRGASRVVAIEPDPLNRELLERNFAEPIRQGKVTVVPAGVWDQRSTLTLRHDHENSGAHSFVRLPKEAGEQIVAPVLPLDEILADLRVQKVDFIKMDIEGSERRALKGARKTLSQFRPRLAICVYHLEDDPQILPSVIREAVPAYRIEARVMEYAGRFSPKVLLFQ